MRNFKRIEPRWKVWSEGRHNLPRQVGHIAAGFCHIWPQVYIQWKVRERMREREYRNRVLLYLNDCEEEERKILACQLYFSMNDFSSPLPSSSVLAPFEFSVLRELGYHFHFIASVAYKKRERKKEMAWPRSYQNFKDQFMGWRGSVEWAWAPHIGPFRGTPHIGTF